MQKDQDMIETSLCVFKNTGYPDASAEWSPHVHFNHQLKHTQSRRDHTLIHLLCQRFLTSASARRPSVQTIPSVDVTVEFNWQASQLTGLSANTVKYHLR